MRLFLPLTAIVLLSGLAVKAQNVFDPLDPIVRWSSSQPLGSAANPNPNLSGLQKWVSVITNGVSTGTGSWDASSFKSYYIRVGTKGVAFRLKFPRSYRNPDSSAKKYPMMLFFHGAGESGCPSNGGVYNNEKHLALGANYFRTNVDNNTFDGFLLYPQMVPADGTCWGSWGTSLSGYYTAVSALIDSLIKYVRVDDNRISLTGLSAGGSADWKMAEYFPQKIASILPSASAGMKINYGNFIHIPMWFATGGKDTNPSPSAAQYTLNQVKNLGGDIKYTLYPDRGHAVWSYHWKEPGFLDYLNRAHKANPLVFFQRSEFCPGSPIDARLGITQGFYAYEWQWNGATIATRTNGVNTVQNTSVVSSFTGNEIVVKSFGTYRVRFKRTATAEWSIWSPIPAVIKSKSTSQTPNITVAGNYSIVLPSLDNKTTVPLTLPDGYVRYEWYRSSDNALVSSSQVYNAPAGTYYAKTFEQSDCGSLASATFTVVNANGTPKPDATTNLEAVPQNNGEIKLTWTDKASPTYDETGFEIYRSEKPGGPYVFIGRNPANNRTYTDTALNDNKIYYYVVRSVNNTGAAVASNEAIVKTKEDDVIPTSPRVFYKGSTETSVALAWNPSTDNIGVKRYDVYVDGKKLYSTRNTYFKVYGLAASKYYAFTVKAIDSSDNESAHSNQVTGFTHKQGVGYKYYNGSYTKLPNFSTITPSKTGVIDTVRSNATFRTQADNYAILYEGYIFIPEDATYTFETISDEGSKLYIGSYSYTGTPVVQNDSTHSARSRTGSITLKRGYHPIAIAYFERTGSDNLQLYWWSNAGLQRERIYKEFFTTVNSSLPPVPAKPGSFTGTGISSSKVRLNWTDLSSNETGFEIARSLAPQGPYENVARMAANATFYVDSNLKASTRYYYRIRSVSTNGESEAAETNALTSSAASTPIPDAPSHLMAETPTTGAVSLSWNDNSGNETGFRIYRSTSTNTAYALIATVGANVNAYADRSVTNLTRYYYYIVAINNTYVSAKSNETYAIPGNTAPVVGQPVNVFVEGNSSHSQSVNITDNAGDVLTVKLLNAPLFVTINKGSGSAYQIVASPAQQDIGIYELTLQASDDKGNSSEKKFSIIVSDKSTRTVYVNFGSATTVEKPWNTWTGVIGANATKSGLLDDKGQTTPFSILNVTAWKSINTLGFITGNNSGIYPDYILGSGIAQTDSLHRMTFRGLNPAMRYNLSFIGSRNEGTDASVEFSAGTQKDVLNSRYNSQETANLNGLTPDGSGNITVTIRKVNNKVTIYLNAVVIEEFAPSAVLHPLNLVAEAVDRSAVTLTWVDRSATENASGGYVLQRATDSLFTQGLVTSSFAANTTSARVTGLASNTRYWFRIRTRTGTAYSDFSNKAFVTTPASHVNINFNYTVTNAPTTWNNLASIPTSPFKVDNLVNQSRVNTGMSIALEEVFNGEFNAGHVTGNNSGVVPDNVLLASYWLDRTQVSTMRISGLNHSRKYSIGFVGSSGPAGWFKGDYTATYTIGDRTVYLNSWENTTKMVYIHDVFPDENGELLIKFSTTDNAAYGFNAGMIIHEYTRVDGTSSGRTSQAPTLVQDSTITDRPAITSVRMYPNPFRDQIVIDYDHKDPNDQVRAEVYDVNGKVVLAKDYSSLPVGPNQIRLSGFTWSGQTSMYYVTIKVNGKVASVNKMMRVN